MTNATALATLYSRAKTGKTKWWSISVECDDDTGPAMIVIQHAAGMDSAPSTDREVIRTGKNIGKANETTAKEQALLEAESRWRKKKDQGYVETLEDVGDTKTNALSLAMPMLAHPVEKYVHTLPSVLYVQPKLDGHRCLAMYDASLGAVRMWSRQGKEISTLPRIAQFLEPILSVSPGLVVDGELYVHGETLMNIGSLVKKNQPGSELVVYHLYDAILAMPFWSRYCTVAEMLARYQVPVTDAPVQMVPTHTTSPSGVEALFNEFREQGFEGAMIRHGDTSYESGYRSYNLLKVKKFLDREWVITDIYATDRGVVVLSCAEKLGMPTLFTVTAPGTENEKAAFLVDKSSYIGSEVTVKYAYLTPDGKPFHPVALRVKVTL